MKLKEKVDIKGAKVIQRSFVKDPVEKIALQRMRTLQLAEELKNVKEACLQGGMDRTSFYEWKRRFQLHGLDGLKDLPPIRKTHPNKTPDHVVEAVLEVSREHPEFGSKRVALELAKMGLSISHFTVQEIFKRTGRSNRLARLLELEIKALEGTELTQAQLRLVEKLNPCFRERHVESSRPGELVSFDSFFVGTFKGIGKVYLLTAVDTFGSYGFGMLATERTSQRAAELLYGQVVPFYEAHGLVLGAALTDNGTEFCGTDEHAFEQTLFRHGVQHRRTRVKRPQTNGFVERFHRTILDEFFRVELRLRTYEDLDTLELAVQRWLCYYNLERPHQGYRNKGKTPYQTVETFLPK